MMEFFPRHSIHRPLCWTAPSFARNARQHFRRLPLHGFRLLTLLEWALHAILWNVINFFQATIFAFLWGNKIPFVFGPPSGLTISTLHGATYAICIIHVACVRPRRLLGRRRNSHWTSRCRRWCRCLPRHGLHLESWGESWGQRGRSIPVLLPHGRSKGCRYIGPRQCCLHLLHFGLDLRIFRSQHRVHI